MSLSFKLYLFIFEADLSSSTLREKEKINDSSDLKKIHYGEY